VLYSRGNVYCLTMCQHLLIAALLSLVTVGFAHAEAPLLMVREQVKLAASPEAAWNIIKDFDGIHKWHPEIADAQMLEGSNGIPMAARQLTLRDGGMIISELLAYDEAKKTYRYRIIKSPLPIKNYEAVFEVNPDNSGGSIVTWTGQFRRRDEAPKEGQDDAAVTKMMSSTFRAGLDNLPKLLPK
jgi:mxaD protein